MTPKDAILGLLEARGEGRTICPSEAARALAGSEDDWRGQMEAVHREVDALHAAGEIALSWKGQPLGQRRGAYRIARR
ncbi:DUF3253 domain-containing protein [Erythrobacter sp.]|uniref:DUF3253 domain-containing protein n=1 Tax=Erythrobacter sp. TaxID=1042 RepID=UPI001425D0AA|nr:DUF3253 domain-containing protein [Erythrobacter sp.]QIQ85310.1 MAG: DUF3253 domain-containing protein [Erythrobacter sp.]